MIADSDSLSAGPGGASNLKSRESRSLAGVAAGQNLECRTRIASGRLEQLSPNRAKIAATIRVCSDPPGLRPDTSTAQFENGHWQIRVGRGF
jgi:hypothetical protein